MFMSPFLQRGNVPVAGAGDLPGHVRSIPSHIRLPAARRDVLGVRVVVGVGEPPDLAARQRARGLRVCATMSRAIGLDRMTRRHAADHDLRGSVARVCDPVSL